MLFDFYHFLFPNRQKKPQNQPNISTAEHVALHFLHRSAQNLDATECHMDTFGEFGGKHDIPSASSPKKWIIGPLFQSLKSKISSFTEIVMSPVKVFKANGFPPPSTNLHNEDPPQAFGTPQAHSQSGTEDPEAMEGAHNAQTAAHKGCRKLSMDLSAHSSGRADECPETEQSPPPFGDPVEVLQSTGPVFTSSIPLCPSVVAIGASQESNLKMPGAEELKGKRAGQAKPRKGARNQKKGHSKTPVSSLKKVLSDPEMTGVQLPVTYLLNSIKDDPGEDEAVLLDSDGRKRENGHLVGESLQSSLTDDVNARILRSTADNQPLEAPCDTAAGHDRAKRDVRWETRAQIAARRKRVRADDCSRNTQTQQLQRLTRKRQAVSAGTNRRGKDDGEMLTAINEAAEKESLEVGLVDSLDYKSGETEQSWKGSNSPEKPKKTQRLATQTCLSSPDVASADDMDLETTVAIGSPKQTQQEPLAEVPCGPRDLRSVRECRESTRNPHKRKSPPCAAFSADSGCTAIALPQEQIQVRNPDLSTLESFQWLHSCKVGLKPQSKRPKKALNSSTAEGSRETKKAHLKTKESGSDGSDGKVSASPLYFKTTPPESSPEAVPHQGCYVKLDQVGAKGCGAAAEEPFSTNTQPANGSGHRVSRLRPKVLRPRKGRRKCRVLANRKKKVDEVANCISQDDSMAVAVASDAEQCGQLLRSYSCPEISTLHSSDASWTSFRSPHHPRIQPSQQHARAGPHHARKSVRRARRHTVCSVEVEREIAPLCLRKEVYPSRRPAPYDTSSLNPSLSQAALASCFLSSPLAFLSKKTDSRGAPAGPGTPSHISPPTFSLLMSPPTRPLSGVIQQPDSSGVMDPR